MNEIDLIQKHLAGQLPVSEQNDFNKRLAQEANLKEKVAEYKLIFEGLRGLRTEAFENEIKAWEAEDTSDASIGFAHASSPPSAKTFSLRKIAVAASLMILVALAGTWYLHNPLEDFLDDNLVYLMANQDSRDGVDSGDSFSTQYLKAHQYNDAMEFENAAQTFEKLLQYPTIPKKYSKDNLHWKKIISLVSQYMVDQEDATKKLIQEELKRFLEVADEADIYDDRALELKKILE